MGSVFGRSEPTFGSIDLGSEQRAVDHAIASVRNTTFVAQLSRTTAYRPEVPHNVPVTMLALDEASAHVERIADDWSSGVDHGHD
jgi:hypothetical protein